MSTNANVKEKKNKKRGLMISGFLHSAVLLLCLIPFMSMETFDAMLDKQDKKKKTTIAVNFTPSKAITESKAKASEAPPKAEEVTKPAAVTPTPEPVKPEPKPVPTPRSLPTPKPVVTPTPKPKPSPRPVPRPVVTAPKPNIPAVPVPKAPPKPSASSSTSSSSGSASSTPKASPKGGGAATAANGSAGEGKTPGSTEGMDDEDDGGDGIFGRKVIYRPNIKNLTKKNGKIQVELCVNRDGKVVSTKYIEEGSNMDDDDLIHATQVAAKKYKFEKDYTVSKKQCGKLTFIFNVD